MLRPPGESAQLNLKKGGGVEVKCSHIHGCGKPHTRPRFDKDTDMFRIFSEALTYQRMNRAPAVEEARTEVEVAAETEVDVEVEVEAEVEVEVEVAEPKQRRPLRPRKPIDKECVKQKLADALEEKKEVDGKVAAAYQATVRESPRVDKKEKDKICPSFKTRLWKKHHGSSDVAACPVCLTNRIFPDNYAAGHIFPESRGGELKDTNILPICSVCNSMMADKHLYFYAWEKHGRVLF